MILIARGIPGSGKTTGLTDRAGLTGSPFDDRGAPRWPNYFSTDLYWGPAYAFDRDQLSAAHAWTLRQFLVRLLELDGLYGAPGLADRELLLVDNTNITAAEIAPYAQAGLAFGHAVRVVTFLCDPRVAMRRGRHAVSSGQILRMHANLLLEAAKLPSWWRHEMVDGEAS